MTRAIMTADELRRHQTTVHGRDYSVSDDGYGDMQQARKGGFRALASWGRDGWDLGDWPYVVLYVRDADGYELLSVCEGDHTYYSFDSDEDRAAALDYLFLWYSAGKEWSPIAYEQREALDRGEIAVDPKFRGKFSWERLEAEKEASK